MEVQTRQLSLAIVALLLLAGLGWFVGTAYGDPDTATEEPTADPRQATPPVATTGSKPITASDIERTLIAAANKASRITGRVVDRYGEPLGSATVSVGAGPPATTTSVAGHFALAARASGSITLLVQATAHAPFLSTHSLEAGSSSLDVGDIQLLSGGGITGRILGPAGNGLADASATLRPSSGAMRRAMARAGLLTPVSTTATGVYRFQNVMPGRYRVTASAPGMQAARSANNVEVKEGAETRVEAIRLEVGFELAGIVVGPDRSPVAGAEVRVRDTSNRPRFNGRITTQDDGRFQLGQLPPGPLRVEVTAPGFLGFNRSDVDPTRGQELVVRLQAGIRVTGTVLDSRSRGPVEKFAAAIRRLGPLDPGNLGSMAQQLRRKIEAMGQPPSGSETPEERASRLAIVAAFEARLRRVEQGRRTQPAAVAPDVGPNTSRPGGRFAFEGLDEGIYAVDIASPGHQLVRIQPVEVRRGAPGPDLRVEVSKGHGLRGSVVSTHDGKAIAGATVELMGVVEMSEEVRDQRRSLYPWAFAPSGPQGVTIMSARTDQRGRFEFRQAPPGQCFLAIRHAKTADYESEVFFVREDDQTLQAKVGLRAVLSGHIHGIPPGRAGNVEVLLLGGHGTMQTIKAKADGTYRFGALQPGPYIVRAFAADSRRYVSRQLASIFAPNAVTADPTRTVRHDVVLAAGEQRTLDLPLDLPPAGIVSGRVSINGMPGKGGRAILHPKPGAAPGSGGLSLWASLDELGVFMIRDVPVGKYTLRLYSPSRHELHSEPITVAATQTVTVRVNLVSGGLGGRVTTPDGAPAEQIRGNVMIYPGAKIVPADLRKYRQTKRVHRVRVRNGRFRDEGLTPGPALLVVEIRGRRPVAKRVDIPTGTTLQIDLTAGPRN